MQCKAEEHEDDDWDVMQDPFIAEGLDTESSDEDEIWRCHIRVRGYQWPVFVRLETSG